MTPKPGTGAPPVVRKAAVKTTEALDPPSTTIFTPDTEFGSRFLIEVVRGCANLCRFCWAGYNYLPVRPFPTERILELARAARAHSSRVGLVSIALCDHPDIEHILRGLTDMGYSISPASLRLDDLTPTIVTLLKESGERTLTIAPETGSDRLRRVINKTVTNDEILDRAELIFASGIENLKLYYMIGLPSEKDDDLVAIRDLTLQLREIMMRHARPRGRVGRIVASVNPLVPKPGTAYQWLPMAPSAVIEQKMKRLRSLVAGIDNVYFNIKSERHSYYQALLSLGDRRVAPAIEAAERNGGQWRQAVRETGVDARLLHLPRPLRRRGAAVGHHRRRHEGRVLPRRTGQERARRVDPAAEAGQGERAPPARALLSVRPVPDRLAAREQSPPPLPPCQSTGHRHLRLELVERLQDEIAHPVLRLRVGDRAEEREAAPLAVDGVLARRERDIAARAAAALPDREANHLQPLERPLGEVQLGVRQLARRVSLVVRRNLDHHARPPCRRPTASRVMPAGIAANGRVPAARGVRRVTPVAARGKRRR